MSNRAVMNLQYTTIKTPLPDFIYQDLKDFSSSANEYMPQPSSLIEVLSKKHSIPKEMVYLTAGIDEAIYLFSKIYGQKTYCFTPAFISYKATESYGGTLVCIPSLEGYKYIIDTSPKSGATLIFITNPNNPAGFTQKEDILKLVENNPNSIVFIDEAYADFADLSVINYVKDYPNMVVARSFSKGYGMAGNRIGYIVAGPGIVAKVSEVNQWSNVSYLSVGAALSALNHEDYFKELRSRIIKQREEVQLYANSLGFHIIPSFINDILLKFPSNKEGSRFVGYLKEYNVIVSHGNKNSNIGLDDSYVRVAIGNSVQMTFFKSRLKEYYANMSIKYSRNLK